MLDQLDLFRSKLLKMTLKFESMSSLFFNRSNRILFLFFLATLIYLIASLFFPLWVLLVGPVLWGVPHLIASLRYTSNNFTSYKKVSVQRFQISVWIIVFLYRYVNDIMGIRLYLSEHSLLFESLCLLVSFTFQTWVIRQWQLKNFFYFAAFAALIFLTFFYPLQTALVALIGHNYLPLINWYKSCQNKYDFKVWWAAASLYITCSLLIYFGVFTPLYRWVTPNGFISFLSWDYSEIISPYIKNSGDYEFWFRIVSLYAFSQALHYFIWLKAIPENYQQQQHPLSFRSSFKLLTTDFGSGSVLMLVSLTVIGLSIWFLYEFQVARLAYFALASYHGFMEISALPFLKSNERK